MLQRRAVHEDAW